MTTTTNPTSQVDVIKSATDDSLIQHYIVLRDRKKAIKAKADEDTSRINALMGMIETQLSERLTQRQAKSVATDHGTAFQTQRVSATISDLPAFREFVLKNNAWDTVDWRANAPGVVAYSEQHEAPVPGLNVSSIILVQIRKK